MFVATMIDPFLGPQTAFVKTMSFGAAISQKCSYFPPSSTFSVSNSLMQDCFSFSQRHIMCLSPYERSTCLELRPGTQTSITFLPVQTSKTLNPTVAAAATKYFESFVTSIDRQDSLIWKTPIRVSWKVSYKQTVPSSEHVNRRSPSSL